MNLVMNGLSFRYDGESDVVKDVSGVLNGGTLTGIIGPNGSGKTTLLKMLSGILEPDSGTITLGDKPIARMSARERARQMAVVPQSSSLVFDFTALDVVMMGRHSHIPRFQTESAEDIERAKSAMKSVGVLEMQNRLATELSGGEWQRVVIARALCQETKILLLDEPVSSLDIRYQIDVMGLLRHIAHQKDVIAVCVMHDLNLASHYCDRLLMMHGGVLIADGAPRDVIIPENMERAYGIKVRIAEDEQGAPVMRPEYRAYES